MPTIAVNDFEAQLPDDPADVRTGRHHLIQQATEPLQSYRVTVAGSGQAYDDGGEAGRPCCRWICVVHARVYRTGSPATGAP